MPKETEVSDILDRALLVARDHGPDVESAVQNAGEARLDSATAERLYTRILLILYDADKLDDSAHKSMVEKIQSEVDGLVDASDRPQVGDSPAKEEPVEPVELVSLRGLDVRPVKPTPLFNGLPVVMTEGFVDVTTLDPWIDNHRIALFVDQFTDEHGRAPTSVELVDILSGEISLVDGERDPFNLRPLAASIARRGVERPAILTYDGVPCDGNRRIAASRFVLKNSRSFDSAARERARMIRVWRAPAGLTADQLDAIVVALNFERDYKEPWPEYVKAKVVVGAYRAREEAETKPPGTSRRKAIRGEVAKKYAIKPAEVSRYISMVRWADDFTDYHVEQGKARSVVKHHTDEIFQWFYEIAAGRQGDKLIDQFDERPELRKMVYDLMYGGKDGALESGAQVRALYQVVQDEEGYRDLARAHKLNGTQEAKEIIKDAVAEARARARARKNLGLEQYLYGFIKRFDNTPLSAWKGFSTSFLKNVKRVLIATTGAIDGELSTRGDEAKEIGPVG